jgi:hypothetical protein
MRVATVRPRETTYTAFAEILFGSVVFNGKSALRNDSAYRELAYNSENEPVELARIAGELATFRPNIVVFVGSGSLVSAVEAALPRDAFRPVYVTTGGFEPELFATLAHKPEWRRRVYGVSPDWTTAGNAHFVLHYNETFSEPIKSMSSPYVAYDAFYLLAYARYAILPAAESPKGPTLSGAFARFVGRANVIVDVGPAGVVTALNALRRGENVDLVGTTGSLDLDPQTGEPATDLAIICTDANETGEVGVRESGLVFRARSSRLEGDPSHCR